MDLAGFPATEQKVLLDSGQASSRELLAACRNRAGLTEPVVNAIPTVDWEAAEALAGRLDDDPSFLEGAPLRGLVTAHKDLSDTAGMRTTYGSPVFADHVPDSDAPLVAHLRRCGLISVGKTNTPEFGKGSHTFNPVHGLTRNPWDPARSAGGSSGGAAVALACGSVSLADGSDLGGSLRNPGSFNGVVGFRPTAGAIPHDVVRDPRIRQPMSGPMGRTVADAALMLGAMTDLEVSSAPATGIPRVAYSPDLGDLPLDSEVRAATQRAADLLADAGWDVVDACPDLSGSDLCFEDLRGLFMALTSADLVDDERVKATARYEIRHGLALDADRITDAVAAEERLRTNWDRFFSVGRFDLLISATSQVPPFPVGLEWISEIDGVRLDHYTNWMRSCSRITVPGGPSMSLPAGFTVDGLPIGIQLSGPLGNDQSLIALAAAAEEVFGPCPAPDLGALAVIDPVTLPPGPLG
jgi:amidase